MKEVDDVLEKKMPIRKKIHQTLRRQGRSRPL